MSRVADQSRLPDKDSEVCFFWQSQVGDEAGFIDIKNTRLLAKLKLQFSPSRMWGLEAFRCVPQLSADIKFKCFCPTSQIHLFILFLGTGTMFWAATDA